MYYYLRDVVCCRVTVGGALGCDLGVVGRARLADGLHATVKRFAVRLEAGLVLAGEVRRLMRHVTDGLLLSFHELAQLFKLGLHVPVDLVVAALRHFHAAAQRLDLRRVRGAVLARHGRQLRQVEFQLARPGRRSLLQIQKLYLVSNIESYTNISSEELVSRQTYGKVNKLYIHR
jgi:hypothetical protein